MVFSTKSKYSACFAMASASVDSRNLWAPSAAASRSFSGDVVIIVTSAPIAAASFTPMWPSPPSPTMPTFWPGPTFQCFRGE